MIENVACVLIVVNSHKPQSEYIAQEVYNFCEELGFTVERIAVGIAYPVHAERYQLAIAIGGDGTVLFAARCVAYAHVPIFSIHSGTFGFLTQSGTDLWKENLYDCLYKDSWKIVFRAMVHVVLLYDNGERVLMHALNEVHIANYEVGKIIAFDTFINNNFLTAYHVDGLIVATPTGSTGHARSAGGPIVEPNVACMVITPVCPFNSSHRSLVISDTKRIHIRVTEAYQHAHLSVTLDGQECFGYEKINEVFIEKSAYFCALCVPCESQFYNVLQKKMNWGHDLYA